MFEAKDGKRFCPGFSEMLVPVKQESFPCSLCFLHKVIANDCDTIYSPEKVQRLAATTSPKPDPTPSPSEVH